MTPVAFFLAVFALTVLAAVAWAIWQARFGHQLRSLARGWKMHYAEQDRFNLAARLARSFPVVGAADLRVSHVLYASREHRYVWLFTACWTVGVTRTQRRVCRAGTFSEPRERDHAEAATPIELAPPGLNLLEQYVWLCQSIDKKAHRGG